MNGSSENPKTGRELSYGEKAVGITFNPGGDEIVNVIKLAYAGIIDTLNNLRTPEPSERNRYLSVAITEAQTAQMWAVKGVTYKS